MKRQVTLKNKAETAKFATHLWQGFGQNRNQAIIFALEGQLGTGKTIFTKALAQAAGITDVIVSPTFILHRDYPKFDHIDAWRMEHPEELMHLGLQKMIKDKHVIVIEWADRVRSQITTLKPQTTVVWIKFKYTDNENERRVEYEDISY